MYLCIKSILYVIQLNEKKCMLRYISNEEDLITLESHIEMRLIKPTILKKPWSCVWYV